MNYGLSYPHAGFTGVVFLRMSTFHALIEDLTLQLATMGFRRIVFLNGHYDNTYAIAYLESPGHPGGKEYAMLRIVHDTDAAAPNDALLDLDELCRVATRECSRWPLRPSDGPISRPTPTRSTRPADAWSSAMATPESAS